MKKGDFVEVKEGILEPEYGECVLSGWRGKIQDVYNYDGENLIEISWNIETIKKMPIEFIKSSIKDGCSFSEMNLGETDVFILTDYKTDDDKERDKIVLEIEQKYEDLGFDNQEKRISKILDDSDLSVNGKSLRKYREFLIENLKGRILLTGIEDFSWEERFIFGYGSEIEYKELRKTNPSYKDKFKLLKILAVEDGEVDLIAKVSRKSDLKKFEIPLSELKSVDRKSVNYELLDDFSVWIVNYQ